MKGKLFILLVCLNLNFCLSQNKKLSFSEQLNPTQNPIGGGIFFKNILAKQKANYLANDKQSLLVALQKAKAGDIIYVDDTSIIDLSTETNLVINAGVTLASGRGNNSEGALIFSDSTWSDKEFHSLFTTGGENVHITGLRLRGPNPEILDHDYNLNKVACAVRCQHPALEIDNCELRAWDKWAIYLYVSDKAYIHHNYIHHTIRNGYGYGIWIGGSGKEKNANALIEANLFEACRHCIASSGHLNSWEARYNVFLKRQLYVNVDRHGQGRGALGGINTHLHHNLFLSKQVHFTFPYPADSAGLVEVDHNWFARAEFKQDNDEDASDEDTSKTKNAKIKEPHFGKWPEQLVDEKKKKQMLIHDNYFEGSNRMLPKATIKCDVSEGVAPLKVSFDASKSFDSEGGAIAWVQWRFGDGDFSGNESRSMNINYTFTVPGIYMVTLVVYNNYGIPSETAKQIITVKPSTGKYVLSCWIKDCYIGNLEGKYIKQLLLDDKIIWQDDVSGDEGWIHIVKDLSEAVKLNEKHRISVRVISPTGIADPMKEIVELLAWIDDCYIFNTSMTNSGFEAKELTPWKMEYLIPSKEKKYGGGIVNSNDYRSGEKAFRIRFPLKKIIEPGQYAEIYQDFFCK